MPRRAGKRETEFALSDFRGGINNVLPEERLRDEQQRRRFAELREALNIDIDDDGRVRRRDGYASVYSGSSIHSFWSNGTDAYFVEGTILKQLNADFTATNLKTGLQPGRTMSYVDTSEGVFFADGYVSGVISGGNAGSWGLSTPALPSVAATTGSLAAGRYQITVTVQTSSGLESGARRGATFDLVSDGGLSLTNIPNVAGTSHVNIYVTPTDGDMYYLAARVTTGTTTATISDPSQWYGRVLRTLHYEPPPIGTLLEKFKGRILIALGDVLYYTEPYGYHWTRLDRNYVRFPSSITMVKAVENGVYLAADKTYWLNGTDPADWSITVVSDSPAVLGTGQLTSAHDLGGESDLDVVMWTSAEGVFVGEPGGATRNLTTGRYVPNAATQGVSLVHNRDGAGKYVALLKESSKPTDGLYASDVAVAEVYRNGVLVNE